MVAVFREVRRVLRPDGTCWVNMGDSYAGSQHDGAGGRGRNACGQPGRAVWTEHEAFGSVRGAVGNSIGLKPKDLLMMPARLALALQADGWWLRSEIIWHKPNPMPESVTDRPTSAHEHVFLLTKSARYFYDADAVREAHQDSSIERASVSSRRRSMRGDGSRPAAVGKRWSGCWCSADEHNARATESCWPQLARTSGSIATAPYSEAHFRDVLPPALAERCIKAGTAGLEQ